MSEEEFTPLEEIEIPEIEAMTIEDRRTKPKKETTRKKRTVKSVAKAVVETPKKVVEKVVEIVVPKSEEKKKRYTIPEGYELTRETTGSEERLRTGDKYDYFLVPAEGERVKLSSAEGKELWDNKGQLESIPTYEFTEAKDYSYFPSNTCWICRRVGVSGAEVDIRAGNGNFRFFMCGECERRFRIG